MYAIETKNLTKKYGAKTVVDHIDLKVDRGKVFGFLGKNGAGKSTLINMITGLIKPTSGSFKLLGQNLNSSKDDYKKIGVLPDYSTFYEDLTALEHLKYFGNILGLSLTKKDLIKILQQVGLEDAVKLKTKKFSFGMKKKLGIAQAIVNKPNILFLDEPTSGVDANAVLNIHSLIKNIASQGSTVFLTSHNLNEVEKICDEVAIMNNGMVQTQGSMEQLRNQYQSNITVTVKHNRFLDEQEKSLLLRLTPLVNNIKSNLIHTEITIDNENKIPEINRIFLDLKMDVYRLEVEEPSLEEIFLNIGNL